MNTTAKPILVKVSHLQTYKTYTYAVSIYNRVGLVGWREIYRGRCVGDATGKAVLHLEGVLRDHAWRCPLEWSDARQAYMPVPTLFDRRDDPVEDGSTFFVSPVHVTVYDDGGNAIYDAGVDNVWAGMLAPWQEGAFDGSGWTDFALLGNTLLPQLPAVATSNYWLGFLAYFPSEVASVRLSAGLLYADQLLRGAGTHSMHWLLSDMIDAFVEDIIDGGEAEDDPDAVLLDGGDASSSGDDRDGGDAEPQTFTLAGVPLTMTVSGTTVEVAQFDTCPSPYYVAWHMSSGGWMSRGMDGNCLYSNTSDVNAMRTLLDTERVIDIASRARFSLYSGFVTRDEYNLLCTLAYAREVYVYDVRRDRGTWCEVESRGTATAGEQRWRNQPFEVQLTEIQRETL